MKWKGKLAATTAVIGLVVAGWAATPGSQANYLVKAGQGQFELLWGRVDVQTAIDSGDLTAEEIEQLERIDPIKEFGASIGLGHTENYGTINPTWDKTIWNVSASRELAFESAAWWFPIVGRVPYLGFFDYGPAREQADRLRAQGLDVHMRTAGAYSTLGWFEDPVLPGMLEWSEHSLANTLLHELAHATVWIPGSVQFNESFANFVGDVSSERYLRHTYGEDSEQVEWAAKGVEDRIRFREMLHGVYSELDELYADEEISRSEKRMLKARILGSIPIRVAALELNRHDRYMSYVQREPWNNARMMQFQTYNRSHDWFATLLEQQDGDLKKFMTELESITAGADDPYEALADAVGAPPIADAAD